MEKTFKEIKKELKLDNTKLAEIFGMKDAYNFSSTSAKKRYENAVVKMYYLIKNK